MKSTCRHCGIEIEQSPDDGSWVHNLCSSFWRLCPKDPEKALEWGSAYADVANQASTRPEPTHCQNCGNIIQLVQVMWPNQANAWIAGDLDATFITPDRTFCFPYALSPRSEIYHWPSQTNYYTNEEAIAGLQAILRDL